MNTIDTRKMAEGILYNYHIQRSATNAQIDVLVQVKDLLRSVGLVAVANHCRQIEFLDSDTRAERARIFAI